MKKLLTAVLAILMIMNLSGCTKKNENIEVTLRVANPQTEEEVYVIKTQTQSLKDLLDEYTGLLDDFSYEAREDNGDFYITSINDNNGSNGSWSVYYNGKFTEEAINKISLADGDEVLLLFVPDVEDEPVENSNIVGGWQTEEIYNNYLSEEETAVFNKGLEGIAGVKYEPVMVLATQLVSGTNYAFLVHGETVTANPEHAYYILSVYEDLNKECEVKAINKLEVPGLEVMNADTENLLGSWKINSGGKAYVFAGEEEVQSSFDAAVKDLDGIVYNPIQLLATQLVSGTNYTALCFGKTTGNEDNPEIYVVTWYKDLQGNSTLSSSEVLNLQYYVTGE